jgi:hypothetical protein
MAAGELKLPPVREIPVARQRKKLTHERAVW